MTPRSAPLPGPTPVTKNVMLGDCGGGCCASASKHPPKSAAADATKPRPIAAFIPSLSYFDQHFPKLALAIIDHPVGGAQVEFALQFVEDIDRTGLGAGQLRRLGDDGGENRLKVEGRVHRL